MAALARAGERTHMSQLLPSWNDGAAKFALMDFVARVTDERGPDFVPPEERIATFDNDGTLWCEYPLQVQLFFAQQRLETLAKQDPSLKEKEPFKAFLEHDLNAIHALGKKGAFTVAFATHAGMTEDEFAAIARDFFATAKHPKLGRLFVQCTYRPQVELLGYLRENGFRTFIVSGGGIDLIRAFAPQAYGIPTEQVVGSSVKTKLEVQGGRGSLEKQSELNSFDDREEKAANIGLHIGRRPIFVFGNSDGDLAMMRYAAGSAHPHLSLLLHHDDPEREFAYDREFKLSPLAEGLDKARDEGIHVVSMRSDWKTVFDPSEAT